MKKLLAILLIVFIIGCSKESTFEKDMRQGKDSLRSKDYNSAILSFEDALIEEPSDKDAKLLLKQSRDFLLEEKTKIAAIDFKKDTQQPLDDIKDFYNKYQEFFSEDSQQGVFVKIDMIKDMDVLKLAKADLTKIKSKYLDYPRLLSLDELLQIAINQMESQIENKNTVHLFTLEQTIGNFETTLNSIVEP